jgi:hypothetical protein
MHLVLRVVLWFGTIVLKLRWTKSLALRREGAEIASFRFLLLQS